MSDISKRLESDLAEFFGDGGQVQQIPTGVSARKETGKRMTAAEHREQVKRQHSLHYEKLGVKP